LDFNVRTTIQIPAGGNIRGVPIPSNRCGVLFLAADCTDFHGLARKRAEFKIMTDASNAHKDHEKISGVSLHSILHLIRVNPCNPWLIKRRALFPGEKDG
jgi:hypothetical protein